MKRRFVAVLLAAGFGVLALPSSAFAAFNLTGTVYEDLNGNGSKAGGSGEPGTVGVRVYLDGTGPTADAYDIGETTVNTGTDGAYSFTNLAAGTYTVREDLTTAPAGSQCLTPSTNPSLCEYTVTSSTQNKTGNDFGNFRPITVSGTEFVDTNGNGSQDGGESAAVGGVTIYQDLDDSNTLTAGEPSTSSDGSGNWSLSARPQSSSSEIREELPSGYQCSAPSTTFANCEFSHTLTSGGTAVSGDKFGNYQPVSISGTKFEDLNANGVQDGAEAALNGVVIYLDLNNDGVRQTGGSPEPSATTAATTGDWSFSGLKPGSYHVREVPPSGYVCTTPGTYPDSTTCEFNPTLSSGQTSTGNKFGNVRPATISGTKFLDNNANGTKDGGEGGIGSVRIYVDANGNDSFDTGENSALTAGNGTYTLTVLPGTYTIREVPPSGYECSTPGTIDNPPIDPDTNCEYNDVTVAAQGSSTGKDFGNFQRASISGLKFQDTNGDGAKGTDIDEPPMANVRIYLDGSNGQPTNNSFDVGEDSTLTAADGTYSFTGLKPGNYSVREDLSTAPGYVCTAPSAVDANCEYTQALTSGQSLVANFGNAQPGSISGTKFEDTNGNGTQDLLDDGPLSGVTIYLDGNNNDAFDTGEPSDTTDSNGDWTLSNIAPGSRTVREVPPSGYTCTAPSATFANCEFTHNLSSGGTIIGDAFGNAPAPIISGTKFDDSDADGTKDSGEPPISGVTIYVDANDNDSFDSGSETSTTTDSNGDWSIATTPGDHIVREVLPSGYECSAPGTIGDFSSCEFSITNLNYGENDGGHDFGNFKRVSISGTKFQDNNADGSKSGPEPLLSGVQIYLDGTGGQPQNDQYDTGEITTTTAATTGAWSFSGLLPGSYSVREVPPSGYACSAPSQTFANCEFNPTLTSGQSSTGNAFGNYQPATISGKKVEDLDADGDSTEAAGEPGIQGVTIYLDADNSGTLDTGETSTTTDANGAWSFSVAPGSYTVREVLPTGYQCSVPSTNFSNCKFTHNNVTSGQTITGDNFGNFRLASIAGKKFEDLDGSGTKDTGEPGIQNVTIYIDANGDNTKQVNETSTTTDANGDYSFTGLHPGNFSIREVLPTGYSCTMPSSTFANCEYNFTPLTSGTNSTANHFGNARPGSISGTKFEDTDADGTKDTGENPISGVTIYLDGSNGQPANDSFDVGETSDITDVNGDYSFSLDPSPTNYTVREVPPTGTECSKGTIGDASTCEYSVAVTSNGSASGKDFGNFERASFAGTKFEDTNGNGSADIGEPPIAGVTIYLDANGNDSFDSGTEDSDTTDVSGNYLLPNLVPGNHSIREELPSGYQCSAPSTTFANCEFNPALTSGEDSTGNDFGNYQPVTVSGTKFEDHDFNGLQDGSDGPLSGVTIYRDANGNDQKDSGEPSTTTDTSGDWSLGGLVPGSITVREVEPSGYRCTAPSKDPSQCEFTETMSSGDAESTGHAFGNVQAASISGTKFEDANGNGTQEGGEGPLQGVTIYDDLNNDDALTAGEPSTTTDAAGTWSLTNLLPGSNTVREVEPSGYRCRAPSTTFANCEFTETLTPGQSSSTGHDFGNQLIPAPPGGGGGGGGGGGAGGVAGVTGGTITGTKGSDQLTGTPGDDVIIGGAGDDVINCGGGKDTVFAGAGNDVVNCGAGNDITSGGPGNDLLRGQAGNDTLKGQGGKDKLLGAAGNDILIGGLGLDVLSPGAGKNKVKQ